MLLQTLPQSVLNVALAVYFFLSFPVGLSVFQTNTML